MNPIESKWAKVVQVCLFETKPFWMHPNQYEWNQINSNVTNWDRVAQMALRMKPNEAPVSPQSSYPIEVGLISKVHLCMSENLCLWREIGHDFWSLLWILVASASRSSTSFLESPRLMISTSFSAVPWRPSICAMTWLIKHLTYWTCAGQLECHSRKEQHPDNDHIRRRRFELPIKREA